MSGITIGYNQTNMPKVQNQVLLSQLRKYKINDIIFDVVKPGQYYVDIVDNVSVNVILYSVSVTGELTPKENFNTNVFKGSRYTIQLGLGGNYSFALNHTFSNTPGNARLQIKVTSLL